ncbi:MAG TPA: hypothetical protein VFI84_02675 [Candidatus Saccharimonadales bacterium]|nr:hypothetical protein [Candidatus Saccharimonadales bacterium]
MATAKTKKGSTRPARNPNARHLRAPKYKPFHIGKKLKPLAAKLPNVWGLTKQAGRVLWQHKKLFIGITLVYGLLNLVLVQGLASNTDVTSLKSTLNSAFTGHLRELTSSLTVFVVLVGSAGNGSSNTAGAYQLFLVLITSLAVIWALRHVLAGEAVRVRDTYYRGMYPLIPFILVLCVIGLQLLPLIIGTGLYSLVVSNGISVGGEIVFWALLAIALSALSIYWLCYSLFALYIVTLPDMTPLKALRSARELVRYRRAQIVRKVLWLPLVLLVVAAIIMLPIIIWLTALAQWVFFLLTMFSVVAIHTYMYLLYRELLNE